jgi:hypothetical protein
MVQLLYAAIPWMTGSNTFADPALSQIKIRMGARLRDRRRRTACQDLRRVFDYRRNLLARRKGHSPTIRFSHSSQTAKAASAAKASAAITVPAM